MNESFLRFLRVGVGSQILQSEFVLVPAVTSLNVDGFVVHVKIQWQCFVTFNKLEVQPGLVLRFWKGKGTKTFLLGKRHLYDLTVNFYWSITRGTKANDQGQWRQCLHELPWLVKQTVLRLYVRVLNSEDKICFLSLDYTWCFLALKMF